MNQSCFSQNSLSQNSLWKLSTFCGYKGIYSRVWDGMWKVTFQQNMVHWWVTCDREELQVPITSYQTRLDCTFCLVVIQLFWIFIFLHALHVCFILASHHSRVTFLLHTLDQIFTLSHTQPLHYSYINTRFLNTELQANLARNKANT